MSAKIMLSFLAVLPVLVFSGCLSSLPSGGNLSVSPVDCTLLYFVGGDGSSYNVTSSELSVVVNNVGTVDINGLSAVVSYGGTLPLIWTIDGTIDAGISRTFTRPGSPSGIERVELTSLQCPQASYTITMSQIQQVS